NHRREQLQRVTLRQWRAAARLIDKRELHPCPAGILVQFDGVAGQLAFDDRGRKLARAVDLLEIFYGVFGTSVTDDLDRIYPIGAKSQRPKQARRGDLGIDLAVLLAVLHP